MRTLITASLFILVIGQSPAAHAQGNDAILTSLNAYTSCLTSHALAMAKRSKESAEVLVDAASSKCALTYLDSAKAYADVGIVDVPASAQRAVRAHAIAEVIDQRK